MEEFPFAYERIATTTWAYMSSLLMLAIFFKFNRFWSVRNFDLLLIILLAPGLLMVDGGGRLIAKQDQQQLAIKFRTDHTNRPDEASIDEASIDEATIEDASIEDASIGTIQNNDGDRTDSAQTAQVNDADRAIDNRMHQPGIAMQRLGYIWLFCIGGAFLIRMLLDPRLARKPLLDPNLTIGGLVFLGLSLMVFLFANIVTATPTQDDLHGAENAVKLLQRQVAVAGDEEQLKRRGPGYWFFNLLPIIPSFNNGEDIMQTDAEGVTNMSRYVIAAKSLAIASQVLIVIGLVLFCHYNYNNFNVGVGIATIYLMLPYTAIYTGHVLHTLPAALMIWALVSFRRPWLAGVLIGLATGVSYYPIFLLPLWISFYWLRGVRRFVTGVLVSLGLCIFGLAFTSADAAGFVEQLQTMFGFWMPLMDGLEGIWALGWDQWYRMPILIAFVVLCVSFVSWPPEKNLGTLVAYSAAIMVAVQFWHGFGGGLYMAWYLPLVLLVFFRPNLNGRSAISELKESNWRVNSDSQKDMTSAA